MCFWNTAHKIKGRDFFKKWALDAECLYLILLLRKTNLIAALPLFFLVKRDSWAIHKRSFFFQILRKGVLLFQNWILQWKATSGMDGRGVEWRIKGVLFFKKWLALYRCIVKYRWSFMIWTVYYPICGTKDYIRYDEAVLLNQTEFLFSDCAINFDKRSFVF